MDTESTLTDMDTQLLGWPFTVLPFRAVQRSVGAEPQAMVLTSQVTRLLGESPSVPSVIPGPPPPHAGCTGSVYAAYMRRAPSDVRHRINTL